MHNRPRVLVGKSVSVVASGAEPSYFNDAHRRRVGCVGVVHAVVAAQPRDNPLVKVKFAPENQIVFFRLSELELLEDAAPAPPERHGTRASHLP